jgi:glucose dehydrogenase
MNSPICVTNICVANRKQTASFRIAGLMLAIAPLWLMLATANSSQAQTPSPADWTQFHRDNMQRWNPYETVLGVGNVGSLQLKWKNPIGGYLLSYGSSPAVADGVVYFGSEHGNVYALNVGTGAQLRSYATAASVESSPAGADGVVYFGTYSDCNVCALNTSTGVKLWSFNTGYIVNSSPTVANGVIYVGSDGGSVYALNASTGASCCGARYWGISCNPHPLLRMGWCTSALQAASASAATCTR